MICYAAAVYFDFKFFFLSHFFGYVFIWLLSKFRLRTCARGWRAPKLNSIYFDYYFDTQTNAPFRKPPKNLIQVSIFFFVYVNRKKTSTTNNASSWVWKQRMRRRKFPFLCVDSTRRLCQQIASKSVLNYSSEIDILMISFSSNRTDRPTPPTTVNRVSILFLRDRIFTNRF